MSNDVKISPVLYTSYKTADERYNVKIRISFSGRQKNIKTKHFYTKEEFDEVRGKTNTRIFSKAKKEKLKSELFKLINDYEEKIKNLSILTLQSLNQELDKEQEKYKLELFYLLEQEEERRQTENKISSAEQYRGTKSSFKSLLGVDYVPMVDVTPAFLYDYEKKAIEHGYSPTTIGIYMRSIRYVCNYCINRELLEPGFYPFGKQKPKYIIPKSKERKIALDTADMNIFKKVKIKGRKEFYLDMFLFSYYAFGMNVIDMLKLEKNDIYGGFIDMTRRKTDNPMKLPLRDEAKKIIAKYDNPDSKYVFGVLEGTETAVQLKERSKAYAKRINKVLINICEDQGITKHVTTYSARHTAANNLLLQRVDIATISQLLGHKDIKTTQTYLAGLPSYDIKDRVMKIAM